MTTEIIESKGQRRARREIYGALHDAQKALKLRGKISRRGVPHLVGTLPNGQRYSVCYFRRHHGYTVFFPYAEWEKQEKIHVRDVRGVALAVERLVEEHGDEETENGTQEEA